MKRSVAIEVLMDEAEAAHVEGCPETRCPDCAAFVIAAVAHENGTDIVGGDASRLGECEWCERVFVKRRSDARYCRPACKVAAHRDRKTGET